ncbi:MAG: host-nuclease inhibitor Gam family protein [Alistipes sp.]|nr:host-nuclease inhibitor Gam family protein [Alistipes sp.]
MTENTQQQPVTLDELEGLNMDDFAQEEQTDSTLSWRIADDGCADWAVSKIAAERAELARIKVLAAEQIERIKKKVEAAERRCESGTAFLTAKLAEYFETVEHKKTKTKHSYRLLSGTLVKKLGGTTMKQDDAQLLEYLKASGQSDLIKTEESPRWGEFKKHLEVVGGQVIDTATGEIVEGVVIEQKPDVFTVDV